MPVLSPIKRQYSHFIFSGESLGRIVWGLCYADVHKWSISDVNTYTKSNIFLMSAAEKPEVIAKIKDLGWEVQSLPGAGHKLMKVVLGKRK